MRRLYRSRNERILFGVCGGLADYFQVDVVLIRLAFFILGLAGVGIFAYLAAGLVLPIEPEDGVYYEEKTSPTNTSFVLGVGFVLIGVYMLFKRFIVHLLPSYTRDLVWPLIFIGLGAYFVWGRKES